MRHLPNDRDKRKHFLCNKVRNVVKSTPIKFFRNIEIKRRDQSIVVPKRTFHKLCFRLKQAYCVMLMHRVSISHCVVLMHCISISFLKRIRVVLALRALINIPSLHPRMCSLLSACSPYRLQPLWGLRYSTEHLFLLVFFIL